MATYGGVKYRNNPNAYSGIAIDVRGVAEVQAALAKLQGKPLNAALKKGETAGAKALLPIVLSEMPPNRKPGWKGAKAGALRKSVWVHRSRGGKGTLITNHRGKAFWWPMVIGGSRPHNIRFHSQVVAGVPRSHLKSGSVGGGNIHHPGHAANPFLARAAQRGESAYLAAVSGAIGKYLDTL